jgi:hypothetical protein
MVIDVEPHLVRDIPLPTVDSVEELLNEKSLDSSSRFHTRAWQKTKTSARAMRRKARAFANTRTFKHLISTGIAAVAVFMSMKLIELFTLLVVWAYGVNMFIGLVCAYFLIFGIIVSAATIMGTYIRMADMIQRGVV